MDMRTCKKCGETKPLIDFHVDRTYQSGHVLRRHTCAKCSNAQNRLRKQLKKDNPLPLDNACELCGKTTDRSLMLDHDHVTGEFRGWLCHDCNTALGKFYDDIKLLRKAIKYLKPKPWWKRIWCG